MPKSAVFYPLIGLLIGALSFCAYALAGWLFDNTLAIAFLVALANVYLSGALHLDGFADTLDGAFSGRSREKCLEIMHDSRLGAYGGIGIVVDIVGRTVLYQALLAFPARFAVAVWAIPTLGRLALVAMACFGKAAGSSRMGKATIDGVGIRQLAGATAFALACLLWTGFVPMLVFMLFALLMGLAYQRFFTRRLGGLTGDTLGFCVECTELLALLLLASRLGALL